MVNRDLNCVKLNEKSWTATFGLSKGAGRFFYQYTKENLKAERITEICWKKISVASIVEPINGGVLTIGSLTDAELTCLKRSFDVAAPCQDCPVCVKY